MDRYKRLILGSVMCCAAVVCRAGEAPQAGVNAVDTNAMERALLNQWGLPLGDSLDKGALKS